MTVTKNSTGTLTNDGNGNYVYTASNNKQYNFTKDGNVYTYTDPDSEIIYSITVVPGSLNKLYNVDIEVSDGVFYINENNEGQLSLNMPNGYTITKNSANSKFTDTFTVSYNEPLTNPTSTTQVTDKYTTTVSVKNNKEQKWS